MRIPVRRLKLNNYSRLYHQTESEPQVQGREPPYCTGTLLCGSVVKCSKIRGTSRIGWDGEMFAVYASKYREVIS